MSLVSTLRSSSRAFRPLLLHSLNSSVSSSPSLLRSYPLVAYSHAPLRTFFRATSLVPKAIDPAFAELDTFERRHSAYHEDSETSAMLQAVGVSTVQQLIDETVPANIVRKNPLQVGPAMAEEECLAKLKSIMSKNILNQNHIGMGYYGTKTPKVILRNLLESPAWYTPYTPYQAEVAQGRLESLLNYQTLCSDLTGLPIASASLLDEGTAAAEAMAMCHSIAKGKKNSFFVSDLCHPQTIDLIKTRAPGFGIEVIIGDYKTFDFSTHDTCGALIQYPATDGSVQSYRPFIEKAHASGSKVIMATDLLALTMLTSPGELGADFALGNSQRFGVPMGYGGPHAAFFATRDEFKRSMPGRIIGVSRDTNGKPALRMAMQTREQHIRRDKANSNICTAQALLANTAAMYAIYHGPDGLKEIASRTHKLAQTFAVAVKTAGMNLDSDKFFDTVCVKLTSTSQTSAIYEACASAGINVRKYGDTTITVAFDETHNQEQLEKLIKAFTGNEPNISSIVSGITSTAFQGTEHERQSPYMTHEIFNSLKTEHELLRYIYRLQNRDIGLVHSMIPLGSCTMKLNSTAEMIPITWPEIGMPHPFAPVDQVQGYAEMLKSLEKDLADITGFHAVSLQPNSGAQGEYAGLLVIKKYHEHHGNAHRDICLIPTSAHGTNPASAAMLGLKIVPINCDKSGNIDVADLKAKAAQHSENLSSLMITYPSTHGVFEDTIKDICDTIHQHGGQVYMDGANMNAQVGLCSPGGIGADVCHLNLHKTFCIPHGGGGPGMGPIGVAKQLAPFLPSHSVIPIMGENERTAMGAVSAAQYGSASILPISWMYIKMMGSDGLKKATEMAILKANYMAKRMEGHYNVLFKGKKGRNAHEFILDIRPFKAACGVTETDVAKRLQDYGFHAPTMSWPVGGTLMIEPTESESKAELDRFCDAMIMIRQEIQDVMDGKIEYANSPLKHAPHTAEVCMSAKWDRPYTREQGGFPAPWSRASKFWPTTSRIDDVYGDRNLVCTCPPMEAYVQEAKEASA